ncbi:hypothetical protein [Alkalibacterium sp. MB6]|uniref:hypothetical protein n=1 Tax=Alkalibacterium sp. MB6 TaxID=2081965 RepID=UPI00137B1192|nr:hypothetical protein [Alkalibacterium sp. MB6]
MKEFEGARVQFTSVDPMTEETYRFSLGDLKEDADAAVILSVGDALKEIIDGDLESTKLTQTYNIG